MSADLNTDPKSAPLGLANNVEKSVSWEEKNPEGPRSKEPHENSCLKDHRKQTLRTLSDNSCQNLSKSEEFLGQISSTLKRNSSDSRLSEQELRYGPNTKEICKFN